MARWLMKSEPETFSISALEHLKRATWDGVRNYQARNFMREMRPGDEFLFYHSSCQPPGIAGIGRIISEPYPDSSALNPDSPYHDPRSRADRLPWLAVDVVFVKKFPSLLELSTLRNLAGLEELPLLRRGNRLSIMPVSTAQWETIRHAHWPEQDSCAIS